MMKYFRFSGFQGGPGMIYLYWVCCSIIGWVIGELILRKFQQGGFMGPESKFTREIMKSLREHQLLKDAVIFKHNDFYTAGIPDLTITINGLTTWFELKVAPGQPTKLQQFFLDKLYPRAFVITLFPIAKNMVIWQTDKKVLASGMKLDEAINLMVNLARIPNEK